MVKVNKFITAKYLSAKNASEYNHKKMVIDSAFESDINGDNKLCIRFKGIDKPVPLNQTNLTVLTEAFGEDTDLWINKGVNLHIVNVTFNGELTKGIQLEPLKT